MNTRPLIALVGRPNVGKSTLFNRLIGKRKSITSPIPGVTRDIIMHDIFIDDVPLTLCDTGGVYQESVGIDALVAIKSKQVMADADAIWFIVDGTDICPQDQIIADHLRSYADKVIILANKVDHPNHEAGAYEAYSLGFERVCFISAVHGLGLDEAVQALFEVLGPLAQLATPGQTGESADLAPSLYDDTALLEAEVAQIEAEPPPESDDQWLSQPLTLAILGQPNTGKSTLLNALLGRERAIVSPIAGTTRDVLAGSIVYKERQYDLLDTAGIRRKSRVSDAIEIFSVDRALGAIDQADVVALLIDVQDGIAEQDKKIAHHVVRKGKGLILVLNKADLYIDNPQYIEKTAEFVRFWFPIVNFAPLQTISAQTGYQIHKLLDLAWDLQCSLHHRIPTRKLNESLAKWVEENDPPSKGLFRWKVRYMTQTSVAPLEFVVFVNRSHDFPSAYTGYLTNRLRRDYDFDHVPIKLFVRS